MQSLSNSLVDRIQSYTTHIPDAAVCPECSFFFLDMDGVREALAERGYSDTGRGRLMSMAACRCPQIEREKRDELSERRRLSGLPHTDNTFLEFKKRPGTEEAYGAAADMANRGGEPILVLQGPPGVGKTTLLECIGHAALERGDTVRYLLMREAMARMLRTQGGSDQHLADLLDDWNGANVLLIDDLGTGPMTDWGIEQILVLIDYRYRNRRRLVVATNLTRDGIEKACGLRVADRLFDATTGKARRAPLGGTNFRQEGE